MLTGDILITKKLASREDVARAVEHQKTNGGRLGDSLIALGIVTSEQLDDVLHEVPPTPFKIEDTGLEAAFLLSHILKGMYLESLDQPGQLAETTKLPTNIVNAVLKDAVDRKLLIASGAGATGGITGVMRYTLTGAGRKIAIEAVDQNQYFGPAPIPVQVYRDRVIRQRITNERISHEGIEQSFSDIIVPDDFVKRLGPGVNSGASILIYGPPGNGKTTVAEKVAAIFENVIYIPYCIEVDGTIIKIFDPAIHKPISQPTESQDSRPTLRREKVDRRWVACKRPVVITGGELNLEMLDLKFNEIAKFYEAPMHMKALNGTFIIDDFGRQIISPEDLLNRWIVPLQSRVDYLTLHSGKTFSIPFDELVIFSTNLSPNDLMDPAFLRRIPYKLETVDPSVDVFERIFRGVAAKEGLEVSPEILAYVIHTLVEIAKKPLACYQPKFIIDQVVAACKYEGIPPMITKEYVTDALGNLYIKEGGYEGLVGGKTNVE